MKMFRRRPKGPAPRLIRSAQLSWSTPSDATCQVVSYDPEHGLADMTWLQERLDDGGVNAVLAITWEEPA